MALKMRGLSIINAGGIQSNHFDVALGRYPLSSLGMKSRKMKLAYSLSTTLGSTQIFFLIGPKPAIAGLQQHNTSVRNAAVLLFPRLKVLHGNLIVGIGQC